MPTITRRKFVCEFELKAVEHSYARDSIKALVEELKVRLELIYRWRSEFTILEKASFPGNGNPKRNADQAEVAQMQKELNDMRMERDILIKAVGIFSKSEKKYFNS